LNNLHCVMRKHLGIRLTSAVVLGFGFGGGATATAAVPEPGRVQVAFLPDGRCTVSAGGDGFRSTLTYKPKSASAGEFRCAIPPVPAGRQVALQVALPPGAKPAGTDTPALKWSQLDGVWVGKEVVPTAPEVVVITEWGSPRAIRARWMQRSGVASGIALFGVLGWGWWRRGRPLLTAAP
jgi:hypothetical protein